MGAACTREAPSANVVANAPVPVTLHVYDVGSSGGGSFVNQLLKPLGTGAFHCGVEIYGWEWSYSDIANASKRKLTTGIFSCHPRRCEGHHYVQSVPMGKTSCSDHEVMRLLELLERDWNIAEYDLLRRNCCHFCNEFSLRLGCGAIPPWVLSLAGAGATLAETRDIADMTCCRMVAFQVVDGMCCHKPGVSGSEEYVEAIPVLSSSLKARTKSVFDSPEPPHREVMSPMGRITSRTRSRDTAPQRQDSTDS